MRAAAVISGTTITSHRRAARLRSGKKEGLTSGFGLKISLIRKRDR
ncbi:MAG: hypothetical protein KJ908_09320 [Acidobacteria bacterium]|nr:hypothetical protein [Acidobacteriota bacterium]MCG2817090.1 hypothetical protein [Candidatus Aminicenantes bacterium]